MNHYPPELARDDRLLAPEELKAKYDPDENDTDEHPQHLWWEWYQQVAQRVTRKGYWTWVAEKVEDED